VLVAVVAVATATLDATGTTAAPYGYGPVGWLLVVFAVVGHLTALQRFYGAWRDLS